MPPESTLTGPFGTPVRAPRGDDRQVFASTSRLARIVPLVVGALGAAIIAGGVILYAAGVIGVPQMSPTEEVTWEPTWEPNAEFEKALGIQALKNLEKYEAREAQEPAGRFPPPRSEPP